jgi:hypothetical protein
MGEPMLLDVVLMGEVLMRAVLLGFLAAALLPGNADAQQRGANFVVPACQDYLTNTNRDTVADGFFKQGVCVGTVVTLVALSNLLPPPLNSCVPDKATPEQMIRVALDYIEHRPQRMHEAFVVLTTSGVA